MTEGGRASHRTLNIRDAEAVDACVAAIVSEHGRLDGLVNNAGGQFPVPAGELKPKGWSAVVDTNLKGAFFVTRAAADLLRNGNGGAVVNVSSVAGITGSGSSIAYCATKGALNTITKSLARVLAPQIRVNAVCPGPINSRWIKQGNPDCDIDEMVADFPIPKASEPDDIADAVLFFACGTSMATGQILTVDGGKTL